MRGAQEGKYDEMYSRWRAAGVFDQMRERAQTSSEDDYDKMLCLWAGRLKSQPDTWSEDADTALNFAITAYEKQMDDPSFFAELREAIPLNEAKQEKVVEWQNSVDEQLAENRKRFPLSKLKECDSLFIGHSNFHDLAENLVELDETQLAERVPLKHFDLVAAVHILPDADDLRRLRQLLKPGGVLIWNTWPTAQTPRPKPPPPTPVTPGECWPFGGFSAQEWRDFMNEDAEARYRLSLAEWQEERRLARLTAAVNAAGSSTVPPSPI
eukprot:s2177_g1.t3